MWSILFAFFAVLISATSSNIVEAIQNKDRIEMYQNVKNATNFFDLNIDVLDIILYQLELKDLLKTAEAMSELSDLIGDVFRRKYLKNEPSINIHLYGRYSSVYTKQPVKFVAQTNTVEINDLQDSINMLKYFGHFFHNVMLHYITSENADMEIINSNLNKYCLKTLKRLHLEFNLVGSFPVPFSGVEELSIRLDEYKLNTSKPLSDLFPNLRRLNLLLDQDINIKFIDGKFSHLDHFDFIVRESFIRANRIETFDQMKEMIKKNPTIRNIKMILNFPDYIVKFLSETLPNLESLELRHLRIDQFDTVHFANVKNFILHILDLDDIKNLEKLSLPRLESFETSSFSNFNEWIQFLKKHNHLKRLQVIDNYNLFRNITQLNELVADLPDLVDLTIKFMFYSGMEDIIWFIRNHESFENVRFEFPDWRSIPGSDVTELQQQFQNVWRVEGIVKSESIIVGFVFKKEIPTQK